MSDGPRLEGDSRGEKIRKQMRREVRLWRSPVRWILFWATMVPALVEFLAMLNVKRTGGIPAPVLGLLVLMTGPGAAFARRRSTRAILSGIVFLAAAAIRMTGVTPWTGTVLLVAALGLLGRAFFGPEATAR